MGELAGRTQVVLLVRVGVVARLAADSVHECFARREMAVHRPASHARTFGDRPDAGVFVIGESSARRVDDLRAIQRCVAALATFRSLLADSNRVFVLITKWNTLTHIAIFCI